MMNDVAGLVPGNALRVGATRTGVEPGDRAPAPQAQQQRWRSRRLPKLLLLGALGLWLPTAWSETVEGLLQEVLRTHPAVQSRQASVRSRQASVESANWQFYPTPSISSERVSHADNDPNYIGDATVTTLRLQQPLWNAGRLDAQSSKARADQVAAEHGVTESQDQLAFDFVGAYGEWLSASMKYKAASESNQTLQALNEKMARRVEQNVSAQIDQELSLSRLRQQAADLVQYRAQELTALSRLSRMLGRDISSAYMNSVVVRQAEVPALDAAVERAQARSPVLARMRAEAQSVLEEIEARSAAKYPELYLRLERQYGNSGWKGAQPTNRIFVGVQLSTGAGLSLQSDLAAINARQDAQLADMTGAERALGDQVRSELVSLASLKERLEQIETTLKAALSVQQSYDRQFFAGRRSWLDLMNAERERSQVQLQMADLKAGLAASAYRIAILTQGALAVSGR